MVRPIQYFIVLAALLAACPSTLAAQSQAFKRDRPRVGPPLVLPSTLNYQLLESFALVQEANAGNPSAQHELGIRNLLGRGFPIDTVRAFFWIKKAAEGGLPIAHFNLGIFLVNGFGADWDPFEAFRHFRAAADMGTPEALHMTGIFYTENFIVPRNWPVAYRYFREAADKGYEPAKAAAAELERRGLDRASTNDIVAPGRERPTQEAPRMVADTSYRLVFVDFTMDTVSTVADTTLWKEAARSLDRRSEDADSTHMLTDTTTRRRLMDAAAFCNPEALCVIGRLFERGTDRSRDPLRAAVHYLRALRLDSYRAPGLLWRLVRSEGFQRALQQGTDANDPDALYVWAGLTAIKFNDVLGERQALQLLERAARAGHAPSMIELGLCYLNGRWVSQDRALALEWWSRAAEAGSIEARIRLAVAAVLDEAPPADLSQAIALLDSTASRGALISDVALAYCAEHGRGMKIDKGEAYRLYHRSMRRGSETAFHALRQMHDQLRPQEPEFQLQD